MRDSVEMAIRRTLALPRAFLTGKVGRIVFRGTAWNLAGIIVGQGLTYIGNIVCARALGSAEFGRFGIIISTVSLFTNVAGLGMGVAATKLVAETRATDPGAAGALGSRAVHLTAVLGLFFGVVLALTADPISRHFLTDPRLATPLAIAGLHVCLSAISGTQLAVLMGFEAFRETAFLNASRGAVTLAAVTWLVRGYGVAGVVLAYVAGGAFAVLGANVVLRRVGPSTPADVSGTGDVFVRLVRLGGAVFAASLLPTPAIWWTNTLFAREAGFAEFGRYAAANQVFQVGQTLIGALTSTFLPLLAFAHGSGGLDGLKRRTLRLSTLHLVASIGIGGALALLAPFLMGLYGHTFSEAESVLLVLLLNVPLLSLNTALGYLLWVREASAMAILLSVVRVFALVASVLAFLRLGAVGFAAAQVVSTALVFLVSAPIVWARSSSTRQVGARLRVTNSSGGGEL